MEQSLDIDMHRYLVLLNCGLGRSVRRDLCTKTCVRALTAKEKATISSELKMKQLIQSNINLPMQKERIGVSLS